MTTLLALRTKLNGEMGVVTDAETAPWTPAVRNAAISDAYAELWRVGVWKPATQSLATVDDADTYALTTIRRLNRLELLDSSSRVLETPNGRVEDDAAGGYQVRLSSPLGSGWTLRVLGWTAYKSTFSSAAIAVTSSSVAATTVITTTTAHGFTSGETATIDGHIGSTPAISGDYVVTVTGTTTFTIPVNVSVGGTGGTATVEFCGTAVDDLAAEYNRIPLLKAKAILWRIELGRFARYGERQSIAPEMNMSIDQLIAMIAAAEREFIDEARVLSKLRPRVGQTRKL